MAGNRKNIMDIRQVLQLKQKGYSNRKVAFYLRISRNTVNGYVGFAEIHQLRPQTSINQ